MTDSNSTPFKVRREPLEVSSEDPFAGDLLDRRPLIAKLTEFTRNSKRPFVLAINGPWGSGKTTFLKMWQSSIQSKESWPTLYFNAWKTDFVDDPVVALVGEMMPGIKSLSGLSDPDFQKKKDKIVNAVEVLAKKTLPVAVRLLSANFLDFKDEDVKAAIAENVRCRLT